MITLGAIVISVSNNHTFYILFFTSYSIVQEISKLIILQSPARCDKQFRWGLTCKALNDNIITKTTDILNEQIYILFQSKQSTLGYQIRTMFKDSTFICRKISSLPSPGRPRIRCAQTVIPRACVFLIILTLHSEECPRFII